MPETLFCSETIYIRVDCFGDARRASEVVVQAPIGGENGISTIVVTLFDEVAKSLIKKHALELVFGCVDGQEPFALPFEISCLQKRYHVMELKSHSYYNHESYESFACNAIINHIYGIKEWTTSTQP